MTSVSLFLKWFRLTEDMHAGSQRDRYRECSSQTLPLWQRTCLSEDVPEKFVVHLAGGGHCVPEAENQDGCPWLPESLDKSRTTSEAQQWLAAARKTSVGVLSEPAPPSIFHLSSGTPECLSMTLKASECWAGAPRIFSMMHWGHRNCSCQPGKAAEETVVLVQNFLFPFKCPGTAIGQNDGARMAS